MKLLVRLILFLVLGTYMGAFYVITPESTTNLITNPSFETNATGWTAKGAGVVISRIGAPTEGFQQSGAYPLLVGTSTGSTDGVYYEIALTSGVTYTFSISVRADVAMTPQSLQVWFATTGNSLLGTPEQFTLTTEDGWHRAVITYAETSNATRRLIISRNDEAHNGWNFYIDKAQLEAKAYATTYCDGDQPGCRWTGTAHASTSERSTSTRSGGKKIDLTTTYAAYLVSQQGTGMPPIKNVARSFGGFDGSFYQRSHAQERPFTLALSLSGNGLVAYHQNRTNLINAVKPNATTVHMPLVLGYSDGGMDNEINCVYQGGLEMADGKADIETIPLQFVAYDPFWYSTWETGTTFPNVQQSVSNANAIAQRSSLGVWSALGTGVDASGKVVNALVRGLDGTLYAGGTFATMGGVANTVRIAKWDGSAWSALGTGAAGGDVYALAVAPDGTLYAAGSFTSMGGVANTSRIAKWSGSAWSALSTGVGATVNALVVGPDGTLYVGGNFDNAGGDANADRIAKWNGSAFSALGTGTTLGNVLSLALGFDGYIYAGGSFTGMGGVSNTAYIARWDGSAWFALGTGMNGNVNAIAGSSDGAIYATGAFTTAGGVSASKVAKWNGSTWSALGSGIVASGTGWSLLPLPDGTLYVGGAFTSVGGITPPDAVALWNGSTWGYIDIDFLGTVSVVAMNYHTDGSITFGYNVSGTATAAGTTTCTSDASADVYPIIVIKGPSSGASRIYGIWNYTTGDSIYLNTTINSGETITITLKPGAKSVVSTFRGNILRDVLPGSDLATWHLAPGDNSVSFFSSVSTVVAYIYWRDRNWAVDNAIP